MPITSHANVGKRSTGASLRLGLSFLTLILFPRIASSSNPTNASRELKQQKPHAHIGVLFRTGMMAKSPKVASREDLLAHAQKHLRALALE